LNSFYGKASLALEWLLKRSGPLAVGINQGGCFMRVLPNVNNTPDVQFRIRSGNPLEAPEMQPNYLSTGFDRQTAVAAVNAARAIAGSNAMLPYVKRELKPGPDARDDVALLEFARNTGATIFHPSGTCKMGDHINDPTAVVDSQLRVHGLQGLRVVDCSVMPTLVSGNTNGPVIMMAEKAVDMILVDSKK
jgi:choline dehydrogenase